LQFVDADVVGAEDAAISLEKVRRKGRKTGRKNGQEGIRGLRYYIYIGLRMRKNKYQKRIGRMTYY
jgi:hypothetical protein